jgi:hypothetical protein
LGLPAGILPIGFQLVSLTILSSSILCMCPNHLSLCALIQRTIFTPPVKVSNSEFVLLLYSTVNYIATYFGFYQKLLSGICTIQNAGSMTTCNTIHNSFTHVIEITVLAFYIFYLLYSYTFLFLILPTTPFLYVQLIFFYFHSTVIFIPDFIHILPCILDKGGNGG